MVPTTGDAVVAEARTCTPEPHVPNHTPSGGGGGGLSTPPGTGNDRTIWVSVAAAVLKAVPSGCSVSTTTIERSPAPTVPLVCNASLTRSTEADAAVGAVGAAAAAAPQGPGGAEPKPNQPCLALHGLLNELGMPND